VVARGVRTAVNWLNPVAGWSQPGKAGAVCASAAHIGCKQQPKGVNCKSRPEWTPQRVLGLHIPVARHYAAPGHKMDNNGSESQAAISQASADASDLLQRRSASFQPPGALVLPPCDSSAPHAKTPMDDRMTLATQRREVRARIGPGAQPQSQDLLAHQSCHRRHLLFTMETSHWHMCMHWHRSSSQCGEESKHMWHLYACKPAAFLAGLPCMGAQQSAGQEISASEPCARRACAQLAEAQGVWCACPCV
jgi:hypothetical protein